MNASDSRCIVLTGAMRGLGRAMTEEFIARGHVVLGCGRSEKELAQLRQCFGSPHDFAAVDVAQAEQVRSWADRLLAARGASDLLLNNAAIINRNAAAVGNLCRRIRSSFRHQRQGRGQRVAVFPASHDRVRTRRRRQFQFRLGASTSPEVAPYCASKYAIEGLTQALAQELPSGMAAIPLNPGIIDTDMLRNSFGAEAASYPSATEWAKLRGAVYPQAR